MNSFDWDAYRKPKEIAVKKEVKPKEKKERFDWNAYRAESAQSKPQVQNNRVREILNIPQLEADQKITPKDVARTALQVPQGIAEVTPPGAAASLFQLLALGESELDPEEWNKLRGMFEEKGIDFDEAYEKGRQEMLGSIPTVSNIASKIEEETGLPLEPQGAGQNALRFVSGLGGVFKPKVSAKTKPSGLKERGFESLKEPIKVSESKLAKINENLEADFKKISDKIIKESPIGDTAKNLAENPAFKQESIQLLEEARELANELPTPVNSEKVKSAIEKSATKQKKGFLEGEYDKKYNQYVKDSLSEIGEGDISATNLLDQYRKNNEALGEYFEPGSSKAVNRAKRDSILDQNRAIAQVMETEYPNSSLSKVFKKGNERWSKIMDVEAIDSFVDEAFKNGVNYKKMRDLFEKKGYDRIFKRSLGEEGYKEFRTLTEDMLKSEKAYKMLKAAEGKGYKDLAQTAVGYVIHPNIGILKGGLDLIKGTYRTLANSFLDKPKLVFNWKAGIDNLKKGKFKEAEREFKLVEKGEAQAPQLSAQEMKKQEALKRFNLRKKPQR